MIWLFWKRINSKVLTWFSHNREVKANQVWYCRTQKNACYPLWVLLFEIFWRRHDPKSGGDRNHQISVGIFQFTFKNRSARPFPKTFLIYLSNWFHTFRFWIYYYFMLHWWKSVQVTHAFVMFFFSIYTTSGNYENPMLKTNQFLNHTAVVYQQSSMSLWL